MLRLHIDPITDDRLAGAQASADPRRASAYGTAYSTAARFIGKLPSGQRVHRVPVYVVFTAPMARVPGTVATIKYDVLAGSATDAANLVRDLWQDTPNTEVLAYGPRGGEVHRYVGWYSAIGLGIQSSYYAARQRSLNLVQVEPVTYGVNR